MHDDPSRWIVVERENPSMTHRRLEYQHALRAVAYLRMLAGERSPSTPIGGERWGNELIPDYPPVSEEELAQLKARIEELVRKAPRPYRHRD
jgi:hypothetical protein